jgi:hypothetical protein
MDVVAARITRALPAAVIAAVSLCAVCWAAVSVLPTLAVPANVFVDFRINVWEPGRLLLDGASPLVSPTETGEVGTVYPPFAVVATLPFALAPYGLASLLWLVTLLGCVVGAMYLCGVRDVRCLAVAVASPPVVAGLAYGNFSLVLVLALAGFWVWRDDRYRGGFVLGLAIASKPFLLPLVVWMLFTRRSFGAAVAVVITAFASLAGWAAVAFKRFDEYPSITRRNAAEFLDQGVSLSSLIANVGAPTSLLAGMVALAAAGALVAAWRVREDDLASFTWVLVATLLFSPIVWQHYYALLLVPLALSAPALSRAWLLPYLTIPQLTAAPPGGPKALDAAAGVAFALLTARRCSNSASRRQSAETRSLGSRPASDMPI